MEKVKATLTVYFEDPLCAGLYESRTEEGYQAAKIVFGAEPKIYEVQAYLLRHLWNLPLSRPQKEAVSPEKRRNPKRLQREVQRQTSQRGIGTKAQQALQAERELRKTERIARNRREKTAEAQERFLQKQEKKREKHRGH